MKLLTVVHFPVDLATKIPGILEKFNVKPRKNDSCLCFQLTGKVHFKWNICNFKFNFLSLIFAITARILCRNHLKLHCIVLKWDIYPPGYLWCQIGKNDNWQYLIKYMWKIYLKTNFNLLPLQHCTQYLHDTLHFNKNLTTNLTKNAAKVLWCTPCSLYPFSELVSEPQWLSTRFSAISFEASTKVLEWHNITNLNHFFLCIRSVTARWQCSIQ